jgi:hypothetical protein
LGAERKREKPDHFLEPGLVMKPAKIGIESAGTEQLTGTATDPLTMIEWIKGD